VAGRKACFNICALHLPKLLRGGWKVGRILHLGGLPALLIAQGIPPLPDSPPRPDAPWISELLAYRPYDLPKDSSPATTVRFRGAPISGGPEEGWTIEQGVLESGEMLLLADRIVFKPRTGEVVAQGHIRLEAPGLRLLCERLEMDLKQRTGQAWALQLELPPHWTLRSEKVAFTTLKHWDFESVELSPCPQDQPGWSASLSNLNLDLDHFATFRNARIFIGSVPILYFPWAIYPAKAKRSSGLLMPSFGISSDLGVSLGPSYYQVLGDTMDATLSPEYYSKKGVLWGGEFRWSPEPTHEGSVSGQYINPTDRGPDRYRYSLKELWQREDGWQLMADINMASDNTLEADYGHGISSLGSNIFDSSFYLGKNFPLANVNISAAEQRSYFSSDDTTWYNPNFPSSLTKRTLPQVQGRFYPIPFGNFYLDGGVQIGRIAYNLDIWKQVGEDADNRPIYQESTPTYSWNRDDFLTHLQGRLGQWGPFRADLQLSSRFTYYGSSLEGPVFDPENGSGGNSPKPPADSALQPFQVDSAPLRRWLGSGRFQLSGPQLGRTFENFSLFGYSGELKHVFEPFLGFTETSQTSEAGRVPRFDDVDSRPGVDGSAMGERSIEFGLKQHLLGRPGKLGSFADLVRWRIAVKYYLRPVLLADGRFNKQGWGSVDSDIDVEPNEELRVSFRRSSDVNQGSADNSLSLDYKTWDGSHLNLAIFSTGINTFLVRQRGLMLGGLQRLWDDRFRVEFKANYDYHTRQFASSQVTLAYLTPCVASSLRFSHVALQASQQGIGSRSKEDRLDLVLTLRDLGDIFKYGF